MQKSWYVQVHSKINRGGREGIPPSIGGNMRKEKLIQFVPLVFFCIATALSICLYEIISYDLPQSTPLENIIFDAPIFEESNIVNRFDTKDMSYFALKSDVSASAVVVAFSRSPILSRYSSEYKELEINRSISGGFICQYSSSPFSNDFILIPLTNDNHNNLNQLSTYYLMLITSDYSIDDSPAQPFNSQVNITLRILYPHISIVMLFMVISGAMFICIKQKKKS